MKDANESIRVPAVVIDDAEFSPRLTSIPSSDGPVVGEWYWYTPDQDIDPEEEEYDEEERARLAEQRKPWLGCAMKVGSNFVEIESPHSRSGHYCVRVHLEDFWTRLRHEPDAEGVIRRRIGEKQQETQQLMQQVQELTMRLGMAPVGTQQTPSEASSGSLMVLSASRDVKAYGRDLERAKNEQLPALFKAIEKANEGLATWMKAPSMPALAQLEGMKESVEEIDDRIFSVSLYAGLTEEVVQCCKGAPAMPEDKLHVMQRMAFMDEECLANYQHGGMEFKDIEKFDEFMCDPTNRDRILPYPRCLVAMRVRRQTKERDSGGSTRLAMINFGLAEADKLTFLYIRNGEQVWRLSCDLDFSELIFPDKSVYDPKEPKMVRMMGDRVEAFMSVAEWQERKSAHDIGSANYEKWAKKHPGKSWMDNPYRDFTWSGGGFLPDEWKPVDQTNVYFDEVMDEIGKQIKKYNRIALIIQGLFDRSLVLHPHPPVQTWSAGGFDKAVKLIYDGSDVIPFGEAPDFEAYRARCNATMKEGSMSVGQDDFWQRKEATKECKRLDNDWRNRSEYRPKRFKPYGDPGPGYVARVVKFSKTRGATFTWSRAKRSGDSYWHKTVECTITVPVNELFNIDAYQLGDYKLFFADSRTRQHYLQWAPLLLAAEEYHAGLAAG